MGVEVPRIGVGVPRMGVGLPPPPGVDGACASPLSNASFIREYRFETAALVLPHSLAIASQSKAYTHHQHRSPRHSSYPRTFPRGECLTISQSNSWLDAAGLSPLSMASFRRDQRFVAAPFSSSRAAQMGSQSTWIL